MRYILPKLWVFKCKSQNNMTKNILRHKNCQFWSFFVKKLIIMKKRLFYRSWQLILTNNDITWITCMILSKMVKKVAEVVNFFGLGEGVCKIVENIAFSDFQLFLQNLKLVTSKCEKFFSSRKYNVWAILYPNGEVMT